MVPAMSGASSVINTMTPSTLAAASETGSRRSFPHARR
jgi:hypothetical protein